MQKSERSTTFSGSRKFLVCCLFITLPVIFFPPKLVCQSASDLSGSRGEAFDKSRVSFPADQIITQISQNTSEAEVPLPGDIIFTQVGSTDPDRFEFVTLKRLNLTSLQITDNALKADMTLSSNEGTIYLSDYCSCLADVPGGTFIRFERGMDANETDLSDQVVTFYYSEYVSLLPSGDQLIAFIGETSSPTIIASVNFANSGWITSGLPSVNTSYCPGTISDIHLGNSPNYIFSGRINSDASTTRDYIKNTANWQGSTSNLAFTQKVIGNNYLPVELTYFKAQVHDNGKVMLSWETATEVNNYGWDIEKISGSAQWYKIGFVSGRGNSNTPRQYTFKDNYALAGETVIYRLKQIDNDGFTHKYSDELRIMIPFKNRLQVAQNYPNPFNSSTVISYSVAEEAVVSLKIFDLLGNLIGSFIDQKQSPGSYNFKLDMSKLKSNYSPGSGIYLFKLQAGSLSYIKKIMVLK